MFWTSVHHQEEQLYLCDTWYLLFCIADHLLCIPDSQLYIITSTERRINTVIPTDDGPGEVQTCTGYK